MKPNYLIKAASIFLFLFSNSIYSQELVKITEFESNSNEILAAIYAARESLMERGYNPSNFFVSVNRSKEVITLILQHQDSFLPENKNRVGNRSGEDHECYYQLSTEKISKCAYYQ